MGLSQILEDQRLERLALENARHVRLPTLDSVQAWAEQNGGELHVRNALADRWFHDRETQRIAAAWIVECERLRAETLARESLEASRRSAAASENAARWAMWSALISAATAVASALIYWVTHS